MNNFDLKAYMDVTPEIEEAVRTGKPVVALESTILSHGMPYPENLSFAREVEKIIREQGAIPATMAIIDGRLKCGLTEAELVRMCEAKGVLKVSRRDLPIVVAQKLTGATTVATTMILANMGGIHIFATGGIGGRASPWRSDHGRERGSPGAGAYPGCGCLRRREDDSGYRPHA